MLVRILSAVVLLPALLAIVLLCPVWATALLFGAASMVAAYELLWRSGLVKHLRLTIYAMVMAAAVSCWSYFGCPELWGKLGVFVYVALLFGERLMDHPEMIDELIRTEKEGRQYLIEQLEKHGYTYHNQEGNFLFILPKTDSAELAKRLKEEYHVLIKRYGNPLLSKYIRISTGSKTAMAKFMEAFLAADQA